MMPGLVMSGNSGFLGVSPYYLILPRVSSLVVLGPGSMLPLQMLRA